MSPPLIEAIARARAALEGGQLDEALAAVVALDSAARAAPPRSRAEAACVEIPYRELLTLAERRLAELGADVRDQGTARRAHDSYRGQGRRHG